MPDPQLPHCSFCGKDRTEVRRLIEGSDGVYICDECVLLGAEILAEDGLIAGGAPRQHRQARAPVRFRARAPSSNTWTNM
jgi:ATP-dependent protease Clp ATPase subunit